MQGGPVNYLRDPVAQDSYYNFGGRTNGLSNTTNDLLMPDSVAEWSWTLGDHTCALSDRRAAGAKLFGWTAFNIFGGYVIGKTLGVVGRAVAPYATRIRGLFRRGALPETVMNPREIHFMQSSIKNTTGEYTVLGNAEALASGHLDPNVLTMNLCKDASGKVWTLDRRRLAGFRLSGLDEAPIKWADLSGQMWKMTTTNGGASIKLKFGGGKAVIVE